MCCLIEELLPPSYYSPSLFGVRVDERLLRHLVKVIIFIIELRVKFLFSGAYAGTY